MTLSTWVKTLFAFETKHCSILACTLVLAACSGGGDNTDAVVDEPCAGPEYSETCPEPDALAARITPIGSTDTVRSGAEVLLSGKESSGGDTSIDQFTWRQTTGETVGRPVRRGDWISFTAPYVAGPIGFELTITNTDGETANTAIELGVVLVDDDNSFLRKLNLSNNFTVVAATADGIQPVPGSDESIGFEIIVTQRVTYADSNGAMQVVELEVARKRGAWLLSQGSTARGATSANNPRLRFDIPALDIGRVNQRFEGTDEQKMLDPARADEAIVEVNAEIIVLNGSPGIRPLLYIFGPDAEGVPLEASDGSVSTAATKKSVASLAAIGDGDARATVSLQQLLSAAGQETAATAAAYYQAIDPDGRKLTLNAWLVANCMDPEADNFGAEVRAIYTNNFDLGFGRDMYVKSDCNEAGDVAAVVLNSISLERAAVDASFIAVAMEYERGTNESGNKFIKFYAFVPDGTGDMRRVLSANFDGRGEKYLPGSCSACHGGNPTELLTEGVYPDGGDVEAIFLPWDLQSFLFADTDPSVAAGPENDPLRERFSGAAQTSELRRMNEIVLNTFDPAWPVHDLVTGWYDDDFVAGVFNSSYLPEGWRPESSETIPANAGAIYEKVIAQNCRACHTQKNSSEQRTPSFATYQSFADSQDAIMQIVFEHGAMPFARLTYDRFWVGAGQSAGDFLADTLAAGAARPGNPIACIADPTTAVCIRNGFMRSTTNLSEIRLDGRGSQFAASYNWTLLTRPSGSNATLTGADTAEPAFVIDVPGTYEVQLTVNNAAGLADEAQVEVIASSVVPTRIGKPELAVGEGNSRTIDSSLLEYTDPDNNPAELIFEVVSAPAHGNVVPELFTQLDLNMGTVSYSHDGSESSADNFFFSLSDGTTVLENQPFPITITPVNDLPLLFSNVQLMLNEGGSAKVSSSNLSYTDADGDELVYTVTRSPMFGSLDPLSFTETDLVMDAGPIYQHDGTENFSDNFDYSVSDGIAAVTGRFEIEIAPISDAPLLTINPLTVMEDSAATVITTGTLNAADVDNTPPELLLTVIDTPDHGTLSRLSFTQQDIIDGLLTYIPALNYFGPDGLTIMVEDPGGSTDTGTLNITVVAEDDVPTLMANNPLLAYLGAEEVPIESSNLRFSDVDTEESGLNYMITGGPSIGTLSTTLFTQSDIDEGRVTYSSTGGTGATVDDQSTTFNFSVSDGTTPVVGTFTINFFASCLFDVNPIWASRNCTNCHTSTHVDGFVLTGTSIANCEEIRTHQTTETNPPQNIVNTASPSASYLLRKSLGELSHGGGIRFLSTDDLDYKMILRWIEEGAENN